jgi:hypothetical protein
MLKLNLNKDSFRPGEMISGEVAWDFEKPITLIEVRLMWLRMGLGEPEAMVVERRQIRCDSRMGRAQFEFHAPASPYSFAGALFAINWIVEASTTPPTDPANVGLTISPTGEDIMMIPTAFQLSDRADHSLSP